MFRLIPAVLFLWSVDALKRHFTRCGDFCLSKPRNLLSRHTLYGGLNPWEFHQIPGVALKTALARIDHANGQDPTLENGVPQLLLYSQRLNDQVYKLNPGAGEVLQIASRGQHIQRWKIPRSSYPMTKSGYLEWRANLKIFHANMVARILEEVGYNNETIEQVKDLILKKKPNDPDMKVLEDALILVFLEYQLDDFIEKYGREKTVNTLRKSFWGKMSETGRAVALQLSLSERSSSLVSEALAT